MGAGIGTRQTQVSDLVHVRYGIQTVKDNLSSVLIYQKKRSASAILFQYAT